MLLNDNGHLGINNNNPNAILDLGVTSGTNVIEAQANGITGGLISDQSNILGSDTVLINSGVSQSFIPSISGDLSDFKIFASDTTPTNQSVGIKITRNGVSSYNQRRNLQFSNMRSIISINLDPGDVYLVSGETYVFEIIDNGINLGSPKINIYYSNVSNYDNGEASGNVLIGDIAFVTVMKTVSTSSGTKFVLYDIGQLSLGHDNPTTTLDILGTFKYETGGEGTGKVLKSDANGVAFWQDEIIDTDNQQIDVLNLNGTTLEISLQSDAQATQILNSSTLQDGIGTDNQQIDVLNLNGTNLEISLQDDDIAAQTLNLSSLQDGNTQNTLDQAYDEGGAGAGRIINVDNGAVQITGNAGGLTSTTTAQLILTETGANDFSRLRFTNSVETDNTWTIATRTDNTADISRMNFNHTGVGDMLQLFGDGTIEIKQYLGVNQTNPTYAVHLPNSAFNNIGTGLAFAWNTYSDKRIKSNFRNIPNGTDILMKLNPQRYLQHDSTFKNDKLTLEKDGKQSLGFIAQELFKVLPEAVHEPENPENELWTVNYNKIIPVAVKAIQKQQLIIIELKKEIATLKEENKRFTELEKRIETLENN